MKKDELFEKAFDQIDDELIVNAQTVIPLTKHKRQRILLIAAVCPLILLSVILLSFWIANQEPTVFLPSSSTTPKPVTVTPWEYYEGDIENSIPVDSFSGLVAIDSSGFAISCELVDVLPASYLIPVNTSVRFRGYGSVPSEYYSDQTFRLLRMKTITMPWGKGMEKDSEFFFLLPECYLCDFSKYESYLLSYLRQNAYEYFVLYNKNTASYEPFSLPLFSMAGNLSSMMAFDENGVFDISLWTSNEAWSNVTQTKRQQIEDGELNLITSKRSEIEASFEDKYDYQVNSLTVLKSDALESFNFCKDPENGLYLPVLFRALHGKEESTQISLFFRRFINGYPTNETVEIRTENRAVKSKMQFNESDLNALPDLASALKQVSESYHQGKLTPPHIQNLKDKTLDCYGILGWYEKTENGVLGIVRVSWKYQETEGSDVFYDDQYFVITPDSQTAQSIDRDTILQQHPYASDFVFQGQYDENGKVLDTWCI